MFVRKLDISESGMIAGGVQGVRLDVRRQQFSEVAQGDAMTHLNPFKFVFWSIHMPLLIFSFKGDFLDVFQHCFLWTGPRTVATWALAVRRSNHTAE
jgi:hypothetical protein